jgi:putative endonuclease
MFVFELIQEVLQKLTSAEESGVSRKREVGNRAEMFALKFLKSDHSFKLIERSMGDEAGEIDLVGRVPNFEGIVVVEVRARKEGGLLKPHEAVNIKKQKQVVRTAYRVVRRNGFHDNLRFDICGVYLDRRDNPVSAEYFPDSFDREVLKSRGK